MKKIYISLFLVSVAFASGAQERVSLIETFTSSTCPPCNPGNVNLENLLNNSQNDGKQVSIKYQMNWPGAGDPYNTEEGNVRRTVYGVSGIPNTQVDGEGNYNTGSLSQTNLNAAFGIPSKAIISASYSIDLVSHTVTVDADVEFLVNTPPGVRIYLGIIEYTTQNNTGGNGETQFEHVMKKMLPDASGTVMSPMTAGQTYHITESFTFNGNYFLPANSSDPIDDAIEHSVEDFADLGVVVWLQQLSTREVYQAGYAVLGEAGLNENSGDQITSKIYPNPTADQATVAFQVSAKNDYTIEAINSLGQVVYASTLTNVEPGRTTQDFSTADWANGLYMVRISSSNGSHSQKMSVQH